MCKVGAPPDGKGQVVFFRPRKFTGSMISFMVREGTKELGKLGSGNWFVAVLDPVVVTGYTAQPRTSITGAASSANWPMVVAIAEVGVYARGVDLHLDLRRIAQFDRPAKLAETAAHLGDHEMAHGEVDARMIRVDVPSCCVHERESSKFHE